MQRAACRFSAATEARSPIRLIALCCLSLVAHSGVVLLSDTPTLGLDRCTCGENFTAEDCNARVDELKVRGCECTRLSEVEVKQAAENASARNATTWEDRTGDTRVCCFGLLNASRLLRNALDFGYVRRLTLDECGRTIGGGADRVVTLFGLKKLALYEGDRNRSIDFVANDLTDLSATYRRHHVAFVAPRAVQAMRASRGRPWKIWSFVASADCAPHSDVIRTALNRAPRVIRSGPNDTFMATTIYVDN